MSYLDIFSQTVLRNADKPAIVDNNGQRTISYTQLDDISGKIASKLKSLGCQRGEAVVVRLGRQAEFIAAEIGVMKLGCTAVPTLPSYPQERVDYIASDCGAKIIIDNDFISDIDNYQKSDPVKLNDEDKVWIIYTSGSTGKPKGVVYSSRVFEAAIIRTQTRISLVNPIRFGATASLSFVVTIDEYFTVLSLGGCSHILSDEVRMNIGSIQDYYAEHQITIGFLSPRILNIYQNKDKSLQVVFTGSERVTNAYSYEYIICNCYGQSETTGCVLNLDIDKKYDNTPIGRPRTGVKVYLLDNNGKEVPDGEEGEICVQGIFTDEYMNLPEQSAKTFIKQSGGEVLVHTGDMGRKLPNGDILYVNRKDWMVKINGQRVEPGEIEAIIKAIPKVTNAAVKDFVNASGQVYLCAYYTSNENISVELIKHELESKLPDYMIPAHLVKLDELPVNINGKLDRHALVPPNLTNNKSEYIAPTNDTEEKLCTAFEKILKCGKVGINDDFFMLGGDSVKVMQLQNECGISGLSTSAIFEGKTPQRISAMLEQGGEDIFAECLAEKRNMYPLTASQMGVYLACVQNPTGTMYNTPSCYTFEKNSEIDIDRLISAVKKTVNNHVSLRVVIDNSIGNPMMKLRDISVSVPIIKTTNSELNSAKRDFVKPFDLEKDILCRFAIFETEEVYCFAMDFHHLVFDGTSGAVILRDISLAYNGEELPKEQLTQLNLAVYEERLENTKLYAEAKKFYDNIFSGLETKSEITADYKEDSTVENKPGAEFTVFVSDKLSNANVEEFAHKTGVTANTVFLGAYEYTVSKFTGQPETVICTVNHGRHDSRMQNTVGMMVRTIPLYANINEESTISNFLTDTQNKLQNSIKNDIYPFVKLSTEYDISSDIMLAYQSDAFNSFRLGGITLKMENIPVNSALSKLNIMIFKANGGFEIRFEYRSDLYKEETIRSFADSYIKILEGFITKDRLCELELVNSTQLSVLDEFNKTEKPYDTNKTVVDLFEEQAKKLPEHTAVVYKDKKFTYAQLDEITDRLAGYVHEKGIAAEDVVSILIPRCEYMPIAALGVLKSGAAYQPLDPSYPPERLDFMIKDSSAKLLIADESLLGLLSEYKGDVLLTKDIPQLPKSAAKISRPTPDDLFILIYTSGSTGVPKGAMLEHKNVRAFCAYHTSNFDINETSVVSAYASYGFDACLSEMYSALSTGAELHIIEEDIRLDLVKLNRYYEENGITHAFMTTQVARQFAVEFDNKSLKYLFTGGERLVPLEPPKNFVLENGYGPTECTVYITAQPVDKLYDRVPIGKALDNIKLYVIDKYGRRLPTGALGELCASGRQVSRGYLNRPEQTEKVYENNPYCNKDGYERLYHTGDIVRFMSDGRVDFIGRNDGQVKIRGFRIELSEVEEIIRKYDGITNAAVIARNLPTGGQCINAYIVSDKKININELNEFIESKKPPYMVPAATMQIDKIPLNVNGKVDKRKLPEIKASQDSENISSAQSRPMTMLEKKIFNIIEKVIGHSEFNISENLMHAGMSSLSVIKLAVELNKEFGFEAKVKQMMKGCSVLSIEDELQEYFMSGAMLKQAQPQRKSYKALYPLSKTQLGVYLDCMKNPYSTLYNIPSILTFPKTINAEKLAKSVKIVILAHSYILTHLTTQNDDVEQVYEENPTIEVPVARFSEEKLEIFKKEFVKPHNLMKAPLFRIGVVETEKNIYLMLDFHHLIFDGASLNIFMNQLKEVYEGNEIEAETYTYFDYVDDEIKAENSEEYNNAEKFFENMLRNFESASEITPDLRGQADDGKLSEVAIPFDIKKAESFCSKNSITPAQLFLAGSFYTVSRFVNNRNVYLSTISNGRSDMRLTNCFGMFVKTLPLGIEVEDISALEFVEKSKAVFTDSIENEIYPYAKICSKFGFAPNIVYEYQIGVTDDLTIDGNVINRDYLEMNTAKFKTAIHIENRNDKPCVVVQYNDALYSRNLMQTLAKSILNTTQHIIENPQEKIRKISMLDDEQLKELESFASTLISPVETKLLHRKFEEQAEKTPDKNAIVACDRTITYSELNRLANITANELISKGLKKGGKVIVLLERTSKIFTSILGILKAGGAFIPTCPDYPKERIESIIEDSEADFVITEGELLDVYNKAVDVNTLLAGKNSKTPNVDVKPEDLAYLIYTSGSTGKPKGVMLRHIGIASYVTYSDANIQVKYVVDNCNAYGSVTTVSFDMSLKETILSLCNGLTLVFASDEQTVDPISLAKLLKENNVDAFNATPSRLLQYMELDEFAEAMANCKVILSGGEKYPDKLLMLLREKTNAKIINTYGPTEITVSSNAKNLTNADEITVGKPLMNYVEHIVDADDNKLPIGVVGELLISGCGVALGYNKLPEQTKKAFIEFEDERTYRSGDYAKWTSNGDVIILGRTDNQVKLRGLRIELEEIEKFLSSINGIKSAVALIRKVNKADAICTYYTAEKQLDTDYIRDELKKSLTDYMVPTAYVQLSVMPLTPNGKINVKILPEPQTTEKESGLEPSTKHEKTLCDIFAKVLELDKVYADDNFFDIGGSSLTVTRVIILSNKSGMEISYGDVFANPTPMALAKLIDKSDVSEKNETDDLSAFDYRNIDKLLADNTLENFKKGDMQEIGDVLLTGAAGFLGIHILYELLHKYSGKVYCLLRDKNNNPAENRLNAMFYYYFEESLKERYPDRIVILNGDVTNRESFDKFLDFNIDTVINCAANVKHFSKGTDIEDVNLYGTLNVIDFCKQAKARLIHVSTMSVGGMFVGEQGNVTHLEETQLYFGQQQGSKYTLSKFLAERAILDEASKGFNAKIMRVGTLAARNSDGEYQINFTTNTFMGRLKSNLIIGKYPYAAIEMPFELSPIDFVAKAILLLSQTPKACIVFHPFNNHMLIMGDLYMEMDRIGLHSEAAESEEYEKAFEQAKQDPEKAKILSSMLAYQNMAHGQKTFTVGKSNAYTMQVLYRMGFRWPVTSLDYMKRFINALRGLGFFD